MNTSVGPRLQKLDLQGVKLTAVALIGLTSAPGLLSQASP